MLRGKLTSILAVASIALASVGFSPSADARGSTSSTPIFAVSQPVADGSTYPPYLGTFVFGAPTINVGNGYNATTGIFTAPVAGYYYFSYSFSFSMDASRAPGDIGFAVNGTFVGEQVNAVSSVFTSTSAIWDVVGNVGIFHLNVGDNVALMHTCCSYSAPPYSWRANFTGYYIHA